MPNVYRKKICPTCGTEHRKRGPHCSASCGNQKPHTEESKQKISAAIKEYVQSPAGLSSAAMQSERRKQLPKIRDKLERGEYILQPDDYALDVPFNMNDEEDDDNIRW